MTTRKNRTDESELESLYRQHGSVEPTDGLDRIIRARAEHSIETRRRRRLSPWLGGMATASVAVLAIAVVLQQPDTPTAVNRESVDRVSVGPDAIDQETIDQDTIDQNTIERDEASTPAIGKQEAMENREKVVESEAFAAPEPAPAARSAMESAGDAAPSSSAGRLRAPPSADRAAQADAAATLELRAPENLEAEALLAAVRESLDAGRTDEARELLARFRQRFPDYDVPAELADRLGEG